MKFYCIAAKNRLKHALLIKDEVEKKDMEFIHVDPSLHHFITNENRNEPNVVFRISNYRVKYAKQLEVSLVNNKSTTFYSSYHRAISFSPYDTLAHLNMGIPIPKTRILSNQNRHSLIEDVEYLGNFPIVIKVAGLSEGVGVIKIDSLEALISLRDYLSLDDNLILMMEFVDVGKPAHSLRGVVIGNELVFTYKNQSASVEDFRSNVNQEERNRSIVDIDSLKKEDKQEIIRAVNCLGLELGGVDFILDKRGKIYIFEVNFPFNFLPIVEDLNFPIHKKIVEYLYNKANKNFPS